MLASVSHFDREASGQRKANWEAGRTWVLYEIVEQPHFPRGHPSLNPLLNKQ